MSAKPRHHKPHKPHKGRSWKLKARRRSAPGSAPGHLVHDPAAVASQVSVMAYSGDDLTESRLESVEGIAPLREKWPTVWVHVEGRDDINTLHRLGELFGIHQLVLEDVAHLGQRAKVEPYQDQLFVVARAPLAAEGLDTQQISLILGRGFVLTFTPGPGDCFEPVRERLRKGRSRIRDAGADYLLYALLDAVIDSYFPVLEGAGESLEQLEASVMEGRDQDAPHRIHLMKGALLSLRRDVWPHRELFAALIRDAEEMISPETALFLRDCQDHAVQVIELIETYREVCADLLNTYLSSVSNRMNEVMKVLTIIATIFIPLGFIAGLYGMNFDTEISPLNMPELGWRWGYPFCLCLMAAVAGGLLFYFKRRGWLSGK
jgi:magnesium transporter